ncbi:MAG: hypothetical protein Q4A75_08545 [Peptostreptococcaceae bacterium]|nr:hypothetical protein [Peptostreptococcaceae bacterium]
MQSKHKIWILTVIITLGFLIRDTVRIAGPIDMDPTFIVLFVSLVLSFFLIILSENKKTHNHPKSILVLVSMLISLLSIIGAYVLDPSGYGEADLLTALQENINRAIANIQDFGFLIIFASMIFGAIVGSDKNIRKTYSYRSGKQTSSKSRKKYRDRK